jgi:hypothetical protein
MPIDPMILNSMLDTFRNMYEQCKSQGCNGENMEKMNEILTRIEELGNEHTDFNSFNAQITKENLFGRFSEFYTKELTQQSEKQYNSGDSQYDDDSLLKSCVSGLYQAIESIERAYRTAVESASEKGNSLEVEFLQNPRDILSSIRELIDLGEQPGMTLPDFLRIQIEKGLDKAIEGSVLFRKSLDLEKKFTNVNPRSPYHIELSDEIISAYDRLCNTSGFGVPDSKEWQFLRDKIERKFAFDILRFEKIRNIWDKLLYELSLWSLSYTSFAPYVFPWSNANNPVESARKTQNITPGIFAERLKLLKKYFGMGFMDVFRHETFLWQVKNDFIDYSQEFTEFLIEEVYPQCVPLRQLSADVIEKRAGFNENGPLHSNRESNPFSVKPSERYRNFYDNMFGSGTYENKYGKIVSGTSVACPWEILQFKYSQIN